MSKGTQAKLPAAMRRDRVATKTVRLTDKQRLFCERYLIHFNGARAARESGYDHCYAVELMKNPLIIKWFDEFRQTQTAENEAERQRVIAELRILAYSRLTDYSSWNQSGMTPHDSKDIDQDIIAAVQEFSVIESQNAVNAKIKLHDKSKALEMMGRHLGMWDDKLTVKIPEPTIVKRFASAEETVLTTKPKGS